MSARGALGDRVETRGAERTTPKQTSHGQPTAPTRTVHCEGLMGVLGAGREETARGRTAFTGPLVSLDQSEQEALHAATSRARAEIWATASVTSANDGS